MPAYPLGYVPPNGGIWWERGVPVAFSLDGVGRRSLFDAYLLLICLEGRFAACMKVETSSYKPSTCAFMQLIPTVRTCFVFASYLPFICFTVVSALHRILLPFPVPPPSSRCAYTRPTSGFFALCTSVTLAAVEKW